ncbi:MAG: NAD(P)/FAD-dependent oxidoreductase, partial [Candidatus Parvarchaeota archaeon]|nr:NAD(P)/FAD-dependent oxidoreductase [Candidatus Parvarchaeota archaeon]
VTDIIPTNDKKFIIEVNNEKSYTCNVVLLCSGIGRFSPTKLGAVGESEYDGKGVFYAVKSIEDFRGKKVMIVGGGDSAFDYANMIEPVASKVIISQHNENLKAADSSINTFKKSKKATIMLNTEVKEIIGDGNNLTKLRIVNTSNNNTEELDIDALIIAIGHKAVINTFKSIKLEVVNRYIKVDGDYKTNIDGIYAVGDVANLTDQPKFALIAIGGAEAYSAINNIKKYLAPTAPRFGGHSSELNI